MSLDVINLKGISIVLHSFGSFALSAVNFIIAFATEKQLTHFAKSTTPDYSASFGSLVVA